VGPNLFQRRGRKDAPTTEFAATVVSVPTDAESSSPAVDSQPSGLDAAASGLDAAASGPPSDLGGDSLPAPAVEAAVEQQPTISHIGRYALKGLLGEGGLGQVHEAWDPLLSRPVAVKTLQFDVANPSRVLLKSLFLNEARAAAGLSHPHIVTVHDAGLSAHGVYIAMERLRGADLRQRLAQGWQPTPAQAALLVRRVADALAYAHARGVVHCDIKPANIFLDRHDRPKVLDFGIARIARRSTRDVTQSGVSVTPADLFEDLVAGSPHYLAPEQLQGGEVDSRTDIHGLGVVFYELLTLRKAFNGDSVDQITTAVLTNHPPRANELRPGVPRKLATIAAKAMARNPADRYASASEMATELRRWLYRHRVDAATAPVAAPAAANIEVGVATNRAPARPGKRRLVAFAAAGLASAVLLGFALTPRKPAPAISIAKAATESAATFPQSPAPIAAADDPAMLASESEAASGADAPPATDVAAAAPVPAPVDVQRRRPRPRVKPAPAQTPRVVATAPVTAPATGALQLAISPWGQVEVDGSPAGTTPPLTHLALPEGAHQITVRNADFPPYIVRVQVSADEAVTVRHHFGP
jgi:eukaryotic-like serine/threonine-protein kinase